LVLLDRLERVGAGGEMGHRVEAEVADVGFLRQDEPTQQDRSRVDDRRLRVDVDREVDGLKEDRVLGVVVLHILGSLARVVHDRLQ
jgi:hypothetical protein